MRQSGGPSTSSRESTVGLMVHEGMNQRDNREARPGGGVANRGPATIGVPAQHLVGEAQAPHGVRARGELHAPGRHLEDVRSAGRVEHVRPLEETRERLAVLAVADEAEAGGGRDIVRDAAHWPHRHRSGRSKGMRCGERNV